jgi:hypothetical protein
MGIQFKADTYVTSAKMTLMTFFPRTFLLSLRIHENLRHLLRIEFVVRWCPEN